MKNENDADAGKRIDMLLDDLNKAEINLPRNDGDLDGEPPEYIDIPVPYLPGRFVAPTGTQRYIRSDLTQGDPDEPLADGQYRWAKRYKIKCIWVMTRVAIDDDGTPYLISHDGLERKASKYEVIGPVIRPPEGK